MKEYVYSRIMHFKIETSICRDFLEKKNDVLSFCTNAKRKECK